MSARLSIESAAAELERSSLFLISNTPTLVFISGDDDDDNEDDFYRQLQTLPGPGPSGAEIDEQVLAIPRSASPLPTYVLLLFLVAPTLKLGSILIPKESHAVGTPAAFIILAVFSLLSGFSNQIWVLMGRYLRKWTVDDVIAEAAVGVGGERGSRKYEWKRRVRMVSRAGLAASTALLCLAYLGESVDLLSVLLPDHLNPAPQRALAIVLLSVPMVPMLFSNSLASKPIVASTIFSVISYIGILGYTLSAHAHGKGPVALEKKALGHFYLGYKGWEFVCKSCSLFSCSIVSVWFQY